MWANADDQGRLCGDPEEIKYTVCPNIDHITKQDIPVLLKELQENKLIFCYNNPKSAAVQMLDWWEVHRPQWAYPSQYPPPEGWKDRLRYHPTPTEIITENWVPPGQFERELPGELRSTSKWGLPSELRSTKKKLPQTPSNEIEKGKGNTEEEDGIRKVRSKLHSTSPSPVAIALQEGFPRAFGRDPDSREIAFMRDIEKEISAAGATPDKVYDAYREAARMNIFELSYFRKILYAWLGIERRTSVEVE
jgi:hypothetical protein